MRGVGARLAKEGHDPQACHVKRGERGGGGTGEEEELAAEEELLADEGLQAFFASMGYDVDEITIVQGNGEEVTAAIGGDDSPDDSPDE